MESPPFFGKSFIVPSSKSVHGLRGDYAHMRDDYSLDQPYANYTEAQQARWRFLYNRQMQLMPHYAAAEFMTSLQKLDIANGIPRFDDVNDKLQAATGFQIVAVPGLIPEDVFFSYLANRRFPVTWWIREEHELDYLVEPDVFHDLFGHVPLLMLPVFADCMAAYGQAALAIADLDAAYIMARFYWYTIEFGLIKTPLGLRVYGSGILSSKGETIYALENPVPNRLGFNTKRILNTDYRIDSFQKTYFVIDSFDQFLEAARQPFRPLVEKLRDKQPHSAEIILPTDAVLHRGTIT